MKKLFRTASMVLALLMLAACISGCGAKNEGKFIFGGIGPITGGAATYGQSVRDGAQIAIDEINAAGGINGKEVVFLFEDDEHKGDKAKTAYDTLMDKGMQVLIGTVTSDPCIAINDLTAKDGLLQITPSASALEAAKNPNTFRVCFTDPLQGAAMAEYATKTLGYKKAAVIYNQDDNYSTGMYEAFVENFEKLGGEVVEEVSFAGTASDFSAQITKIAATDAEFIFLPIYAEKAAQIIITAESKGLDIAFLGGDGLDGILNYMQGDNAKLAEGLIYLTPFVSSDADPKVQAFTKKYEDKYGKTPDQFAADGYDCVYLAKLAIEKAGVTDPAKMTEDATKAAVIKAMTEIEYAGLTGTMTFTADGEPNKGAKVAKIVNGEYVAQ